MTPRVISFAFNAESHIPNDLAGWVGVSDAWPPQPGHLSSKQKRKSMHQGCKQRISNLVPPTRPPVTCEAGGAGRGRCDSAQPAPSTVAPAAAAPPTACGWRGSGATVQVGICAQLLLRQSLVVCSYSAEGLAAAVSQRPHVWGCVESPPALHRHQRQSSASSRRRACTACECKLGRLTVCLSAKAQAQCALVLAKAFTPLRGPLCCDFGGLASWNQGQATRGQATRVGLSSL